MAEVSPVYKQFLAIICCHLISLSFGSITGWATINFLELQNNKTTFPLGPLNLDEATLTVSLIDIGGFIGNFSFLPLIQLLGVKRTIHFSTLPLILSSVLTIWAPNVYTLYAARVIAGCIGGSLIVTVPSFIADISYDNVRGALNSLYDPAYNSGIMIAYFMANYLSCMDQLKVQMIVPAIAAIVLFAFPESPEYWQSRRQFERAFRSRLFYKGDTVAPEEIEFMPKLQDKKAEIVQFEKDVDEDESNSKLTIRDFFTPQARKAYFIALSLSVLSFCAGTFIILSYVTVIFSKSGSSLSTTNSSLLVSMTQLIGNLVFVNIVERFNRKTLYISSSIMTAIGYFLFASYCLFLINEPEHKWMPPFFFACIIFSSTMGLFPIPCIIFVEIFPKKIRQICFAFTVSMLWIVLFLLDNIFPSFLEKVDLPICLLTLGAVSLLNAVFGIFCVPETRGKSHQEIMKLLN